MRMTLITTLVLQAILRGHRFGFEIVDVTGYSTGTVYPALRRLEHAGFVRSEWERERVAADRGASAASPDLDARSALAPPRLDARVGSGARSRRPRGWREWIGAG